MTVGWNRLGRLSVATTQVRNADLEVQDAEHFEIDQGTKGGLDSPAIADTI